MDELKKKQSMCTANHQALAGVKEKNVCMSVSAPLFYFFFFAADAEPEVAALASQSPKAVSSPSAIRLTTPESSANSITV